MCCNVESQRKEFIDIVCNTIHRDGICDLMDYLEDNGFYTCPASTKYHGAYEGGLVEHSINVYYTLKDMIKYIFPNEPNKYSEETIAIVSLFHDLCKIDKYMKGTKNVKNKETGEWEQVEVFEYNPNQVRLGHASSSVYKILDFIMLTEEEKQAIHWHMGAFDISPYNSNYDMGNAFNNNTLAFALHMADMMATYVVENEHLN